MNRTKKLKYIGESTGNSMVPLINEGDQLYIVKITPKSLRLGDLVIFYFHKRLICHRVLRKKKTTIITKGDNNWFIDSPLTYKKIVGKLILVKNNRYVLDLLSKKSIILQLYLLYCGWITFYLPYVFGKILSIIFKNRKLYVALTKKVYNEFYDKV